MAFNRLLTSAYTILLNNSSSDHHPSEENCKDLEIKPGRSFEKFGAAGFQMPLHYPRYKKSDYEKMEEWKLDMLLHQYGLPCRGNLEEKRRFAMGAFLWPAD